MGNSYHDGNHRYGGRVIPKFFSPPDECITDDAFSSDDDDRLTAVKQQQQYSCEYSQESDTTAETETRVIHVCYGEEGEVIAFQAGSVVACIGPDSISIDLLKNGSTVLDSVIVLDSSNSARTPEEATLDPAEVDLEEGDVLEAEITTSAGTGTLAKGVFIQAIIREDPSGA